MFRDLVLALGGGVANANGVLTTQTPQQLGAFLELAWRAPRSPFRATVGPVLRGPGGPLNAELQSRFEARNAAELGGRARALDLNALGLQVYWRHLIYSYLIESTGITEVFRRVLEAWTSSELLPFPSLETQWWIRATEELFFKTPSPFFHSLASDIRPDPERIRENAYMRLLGLKLDHPNGATGPVANSYLGPVVANTEFVSLFERLLQEVWVARVYAAPGPGPNPTDFQAMAELVRQIEEVLLERRTYGALLREEFEADAMMSWLHLTLEDDNFVIQDLHAASSSPARRLSRIAEQVGLTLPAACDSYFQLADAMSEVLIFIENGFVQAALNANNPVLSNPAANAALTADIQTITTHWSIVTGRPMKGQVAPLAPVVTAPPVALPAGAGPILQAPGITPPTMTRQAQFIRGLKS